MFDWFPENFLKGNADKCHLIPSSNVPVDIQISNIKVTSEARVIQIDNIDNRLNFDYNFSQLCKKASQKLHALAGIFKYNETLKPRFLVNSFITSEFSYCPLICMFNIRRMEDKINKTYERAFSLFYPSDSELTFKELSDKNKAVGIHEKSL